MSARNQARVFSMAGTVLLALATEIIVGYHYWRMLTGIATVALLGLCVVAYVLLWSSWWASAEEEDKRVQWTAYFVALSISLVMIMTAGAALIILRQDRQAETQNARELETARMQAEELRKIRQETGSWRTAQQFAEIEKERMKKQADEELAAAEAVSIENQEWMKSIESYGRFYIYFVPFLAAILGKFALLMAIALPGGASGYSPQKRTKSPTAEPEAVNPKA